MQTNQYLYCVYRLIRWQYIRQAITTKQKTKSTATVKSIFFEEKTLSNFLYKVKKDDITNVSNLSNVMIKFQQKKKEKKTSDDFTSNLSLTSL